MSDLVHLLVHVAGPDLADDLGRVRQGSGHGGGAGRGRGLRHGGRGLGLRGEGVWGAVGGSRSKGGRLESGSQV